jgi:hypothetical protein
VRPAPASREEQICQRYAVTPVRSLAPIPPPADQQAKQLQRREHEQ